MLWYHKNTSSWANVYCQHRWLKVNKNFKDLNVSETLNAFFSKPLILISADTLLQNGCMIQFGFLTVASQLNFIWNYTLKKSLSIVKLRSFQNASIENKQISFVSQQNRLFLECIKIVHFWRKKFDFLPKNHQ